ncbi:MAG TPA: OsmC family protein [Nitrospiria bacterium]|nr:OsmC family protein [Nitrospiria bacterium]
MEVRPKSYRYQTAVRWTGERKGIASSAGKPDVEVATPPEFKGHAGIWSPEDLFVASANICLMTTFLSFAERAGLSFTAFESEAEGLLELVDGKFVFTSIVLKPRITLKPGEDAGKAKGLIEKAEANCLISNSMKAKVTLEPNIV